MLSPTSNPILRHNSVHASRETLADEQASHRVDEADPGNRMVDHISNHRDPSIALGRSRTERCSGWPDFASDSTGGAAIACTEAQYKAPYDAKPSMKNADIDDHNVLFRRSARVIAGITAGSELAPAKSSSAKSSREAKS
jgi:hypothetical protein